MSKKEKIMIEALNKIAFPIKYLQEEAEAHGGRINHIALELSQDHNWLKSIAKEALDRIETL